MRTFFYHYNKPASMTAGKPKLSVHFKDTCHIVDHIKCGVPCFTHHRKIQPRCIMKGKAHEVVIEDGVATIS